MIMYEIHTLSPSYLRRIFTHISNVHAHNLRKSERYIAMFPDQERNMQKNKQYAKRRGCHQTPI